MNLNQKNNQEPKRLQPFQLRNQFSKQRPHLASYKKRYYTWNDYLQEKFDQKVFKVPLDGGFTCPNRDGTKSFNGCTFCSASGSGDTLIAPEKSIPEQFYLEINSLQKKWPQAGQYIVYFQNFTNTYAPVKKLRQIYQVALNLPNVVGINIGTRPDCLEQDIIDYLAELNQQTLLWVELGLQTTYDQTSQVINRAHDYKTYLQAVANLRKHNINVCTHLINGLPNETYQMMLNNVIRTVQQSDIQGIKLHLLHLIKGTKILRDFHAGTLKLMRKTDYVNLIVDQLERIPPQIVIHRLTGDAPRKSLVGPVWSLKKWEVLNAIDDELARRGSFQGRLAKSI